MWTHLCACGVRFVFVRLIVDRYLLLENMVICPQAHIKSYFSFCVCVCVCECTFSEPALLPAYKVAYNRLRPPNVVCSFVLGCTTLAAAVDLNLKITINDVWFGSFSISFCVLNSVELYPVWEICQWASIQQIHWHTVHTQYETRCVTNIIYFFGIHTFSAGHWIHGSQNICWEVWMNSGKC